MYNVLLNRKGEPLKIALIGGARTGKDTIAHYLNAVGEFQRFAFGDALKDKLFKVFPDLPQDPKPRQAMIVFGQACREIDPLVWIKYVDMEINIYKNLGIENVVITDVRQPNEVEYCKENGFTLVKVVAGAETCKERALETGEVLNVNNELDILARSFEDYDYIIENNGSLDELYQHVDKILQNG